MSNQLEKLGYNKKTCKTCGKDFWSMNDRETCGDAPAINTSLLEIRPPHRNMIYTKYRKFSWISSKTRITPHKKVSSTGQTMRDDVFLVGASIYDFQPWVTSGMVDPPANPLVVAQPSIRLNDVDNVGRTEDI